MYLCMLCERNLRHLTLTVDQILLMDRFTQPFICFTTIMQWSELSCQQLLLFLFFWRKLQLYSGNWQRKRVKRRADEELMWLRLSTAFVPTRPRHKCLISQWITRDASTCHSKNGLAKKGFDKCSTCCVTFSNLRLCLRDVWQKSARDVILLLL